MSKVILGLAGEISSGKGTVAKYIVEKHNGSTHRFSTVLRDVLGRIYLEESRDNMQKTSTMLRTTFRDDILSLVVSRDVEKDDHEIVAVDGVRRLPDIEHLKKIPGFKLVYIDTDLKNSYDRIITRGENPDDKEKTFEQFQKDHEKEAELQIRGLKDHADYVVDNNGSFEDLYKQVDEIIDKSRG